MDRLPPTRRLVLASASPRRRALLAALDVPFTVVTADTDESIAPSEAPAAAAVRLALAKAMAAAASIDRTGARHHPDGPLVLGADTIVVAPIDGPPGVDARDGAARRHPTVLGKPRDAAQAAAFLRRLRGRRHDVITGVALVDAATARVVTAFETTAVWMRAYGDAEIAAYIDTGDPLDKAGAYAIQHRGFRPVGALVGSEANVIGLPIGLVRGLLARAHRYPVDTAPDLRDARTPARRYPPA